MSTHRPFAELNVWQKIFAEHWESFSNAFFAEHNCFPPEHWHENVMRMIGCGDIREGYYEYLCRECGATRKVGFTCKSRLCLRCAKSAIDDWLAQMKSVLFEGVVHRQVVLTIPPAIRPLVLSDCECMKAFADAGASAIKKLLGGWRRNWRLQVGLVAVMQLHGRAGNQNPHLHFVVSEGGVDKDGLWREITYFATRKLRKLWQYEVITALKKAVRGTPGQKKWNALLGSMFGKYPTGFDVGCMPEKGPIERLVTYLCKYVSSPPISLRRIVRYDGVSVTFNYSDHRRGFVCETLPAAEFIGRMILHLPPKGFRMVRYYGIYARPVRRKFHEKVRHCLARLVRRMESAAQRFALRRDPGANKRLPAAIGKAPLRCDVCGSENLELICVWDKKKGFLFHGIRGEPPANPGDGSANSACHGHYVQLSLPF